MWLTDKKIFVHWKMYVKSIFSHLQPTRTNSKNTKTFLKKRMYHQNNIVFYPKWYCQHPVFVRNWFLIFLPGTNQSVHVSAFFFPSLSCVHMAWGKKWLCSPQISRIPNIIKVFPSFRGKSFLYFVWLLLLLLLLFSKNFPENYKRYLLETLRVGRYWSKRVKTEGTTKTNFRFRSYCPFPENLVRSITQEQ